MEAPATDGESSNQGTETTPVTFWQEVTDPKTNHCYYWNPATNEVNWTLPPNAVISNPADNTDKLAVLLTNSNEPVPGSNEISGYYDHYAKTWYGADPTVLREQQKALLPEEPKEPGATDGTPATQESGEVSAVGGDATAGKGEEKKDSVTAKKTAKKSEGEGVKGNMQLCLFVLMYLYAS